jgi:hypothetical protein
MASQRIILSLSRSIATKVCAAAGAALALAALAGPLLACQGPQFEQTILLGAIPPVAEASEVIARVEIVDVHTRQPPGLRALHVARARVLKSIRGTADGQIVEIDAEESSCGGGLGRNDVGRQGFIAGHFVQSANGTLFHGRWSEARIGSFFPALQPPETRPWWRMPWHTYYSPWYYRAALIALVLYLLWRVAGWLDRREGKTE